jgi:hypothetical protein
MADFLGGIAHSSELVQAELTAMQKRVDKATIAAVKRVQTMTKTSVKGQMRGRPRWNHRGKSARTGPNVTIPELARNNPRSGGPGKLTGELIKSIKQSKRPRKTKDGYSGVVWSGGVGAATNLYKAKTEKIAPYFKPGVDKATPKMPAVWETAWGKAINK